MMAERSGLRFGKVRMMSSILAALLLAPAASASASAPPAEPQQFFACPAGFTLETTTQPGPQGAQRLAGVRCAARAVAPPICAAGTVLTVVAGPDTCLPSRTATGTGTGNGTGAVVDGTSNTVAIGETAASPGKLTDGASNTIAIGETGTPPAPRCRLAGERLRIDSQRTRDECIRTDVRAPTQAITIAPRG